MSHSELLKTIRDELQAENLLIFHRISWFVATQALLIAVFGVAAKEATLPALCLLQHLIPLLGGMLSVLAWAAVCSAITVQLDLIELQAEAVQMALGFAEDEKEKTALNCYVKLTCLGRPSGSRSHWFSIVPPFVVPFLFSLLWLAVYHWLLEAHPEEITHWAFVARLILTVIVGGIFGVGLRFVFRWRGRP